MIRLKQGWRASGLLLAGVMALAAGNALAQRGIAGTAPAAGGEKWAIIIGVGKYQDSGFSALPNAVSDARAIRDQLIAMPEGFSETNILLLIDGIGEKYAPTRANIMRYLGSYLPLTQPNDTLLFYFAGHGITEQGKLYLMPSDSVLQNVSLSGFPFIEIERSMKSAAAKRKILILDACHSGAGRGANMLSADAVRELERASEGMVTLASCSADEQSHEMPDTGHGAFTHFLLEALQGKADRDQNGYISASEASYYTWDATRRWAATKGLKQTPWRREEGSGEILLAKAFVVQGSNPSADAVVSAQETQKLAEP